MKSRFLIYAALILVLIASCKKETSFLYEVDPVSVTQNGGNGKNNVKSTTEFVSIAYADIFGTNISTSYLQDLSTVYNAFGDKKMIEDRIIRAFLNSPSAIIPGSVSVGGDTSVFVVNTYKKLYNRDPNEFEKYYTVQLIRNETYMSAKVIYYALMTSDEYRYY
jgi:hypothetical protein